MWSDLVEVEEYGGEAVVCVALLAPLAAVLSRVEEVMVRLQWVEAGVEVGWIGCGWGRWRGLGESGCGRGCGWVGVSLGAGWGL